jgi:hypothetical protein
MTRRDYVSYLLRLWQTGNEEKAVWRASLENPLTGERQGFASLDELIAFLKARIGNQTLAPADNDEPVTVNRERKVK